MICFVALTAVGGLVFGIWIYGCKSFARKVCFFLTLHWILVFIIRYRQEANEPSDDEGCKDHADDQDEKIDIDNSDEEKENNKHNHQKQCWNMFPKKDDTDSERTKERKLNEKGELSTKQISYLNKSKSDCHEMDRYDT